MAPNLTLNAVSVLVKCALISFGFGQSPMSGDLSVFKLCYNKFSLISGNAYTGRKFVKNKKKSRHLGACEQTAVA